MNSPSRQNSKRSVAQLRRVARNWQQRAWLGVGLVVLSVVGLILCWTFHAHWFWWMLCGLGVMSALIEVFADLNAIHDTRKHIAQLEAESTTH